MRVLDESFFKKTVPLTAARIFDPRHTTIIRKRCRIDTLDLPKVPPLQLDPDQERFPGKKVLLLRPEVKFDGVF